MGVKSIIKPLKASLEKIEGIVSVFDFYPFSIDDAELPAIIVSPAQSRYEYRSEDVAKDPRTYRVLVLYGKFLQGREGDAPHSAYEIHDAVKLHLLKEHSLITDDNERIIINVLGDDGVMVRRYPNNSENAYVSTEWQVSCAEWESF